MVAKTRAKKTSTKQRSKELSDTTLELAEEVAKVSKHRVTTGRVRIALSTESFEDIVRADLQSVSVEVLRVPIDQPVEGDVPQVRTEGDVTIIPVLEEVLFVEKRLMLKEELHIRRKAESEVVEKPVLLRRQKVDIGRLKP